MARQNHAEQSWNHCWPEHKRRGRMILSCHDSIESRCGRLLLLLQMLMLRPFSG
jgi:hypothetical protein